ncbi:hypothetical protein SAMN06297358_0031 [Pedobacter xixiisoli]|uniref:Uncharacterized protein n=1 Tax=Pedobacter xixiisoli TaxID=1476464 RepID=A0A285ZNG4_9SPHI|nr:hypothetical protein SAMN06297358_0031 [Pedobacter xixiisoli]
MLLIFNELNFGLEVFSYTYCHPERSEGSLPKFALPCFNLKTDFFGKVYQCSMANTVPLFAAIFLWSPFPSFRTQREICYTCASN